MVEPVRGVHLFVPMLHRHDAVGEHTLVLRDRLRARGVPSRIYSEIPDPATTGEAQPYLEYAGEAEPGDVLVYQFATASRMAAWLTERPERLVLNHHSVTPPSCFRRWNVEIARLQQAALAELALVAPRADLGLAVSRFDADELVRAGCRRVEVVPVANVALPPPEPDPATLARRRRRGGGGASWLSVGRLAPNKAHERTLLALLAARRTADRDTRLTVVGAPSEPQYARALRRFAASLGLADAVDFVTGLSDEELAAYYRTADVVVMLSEHEGFGVPLVEAMAQGVPVVAYRSGAVAETVGHAGLLLETRAPRRVAEAVGRVLGDRDAVQRLVEAGRRRVGDLGLDQAADRFVDRVLELAGPVPANA